MRGCQLSGRRKVSPLVLFKGSKGPLAHQHTDIHSGIMNDANDCAISRIESGRNVSIEKIHEYAEAVAASVSTK